MRQVRKRVAGVVKHIGRRGVFLVFLALVAGSANVSLLDPTQWPALTKTFRVMHEVPPNMWAAAWGVMGVFCLIGAVAKQIEEWAFGVAALMLVLWSLIYLQAWHDATLARPWTGFVLYSAFAGLVLVISGWPEENGDRR